MGGGDAVPSDVSFSPKLDRGRAPTQFQHDMTQMPGRGGRGQVKGETWAQCGDSITLTGNTIKRLGELSDGLFLLSSGF